MYITYQIPRIYEIPVKKLKSIKSKKALFLRKYKQILEEQNTSNN